MKNTITAAAQAHDIGDLIVRSATMALEAYGDSHYHNGEPLPASDKADIIRANADAWVQRVCASILN
jgi:hypothetical protein